MKHMWMKYSVIAFIGACLGSFGGPIWLVIMRGVMVGVILGFAWAKYDIYRARRMSP